MSRHYLKIPNSIRNWYPGAAPADWREAIFRDVTEEGRRLVLERLPANEMGERLGLHGDRFYVVVGRDKDRYDTFYVIRIESAERNPLRRVPVKLDCQIALWPGGIPEHRDPVGPLFGPEGQGSKASLSTVGTEAKDTENESVDSALQTQPSPLLQSMLHQTPASIREKFRPGSQPEEPIEAAALVDMIAVVWRKRRLDRYISPSLRHDSLLKGLVRPANLGRKERDALLGLCAFELLNKASLEHRNDAGRFFGILQDLSQLRLLPFVGAGLWTLMLGGMSSSELREELRLSAEGLSRVAADGVPAEQAWEDGLVRALREVATREQDPVLTELIEGAEASADPIGHIASWAMALPVVSASRDEVPSEPEPVTTPPSSYSASVEEQTGQVDPADAWALRIAVPDDALLTKVQHTIELLRMRAHSVRPPFKGLSELVGASEVLQQFQALAAALLEELTDTQQLQEELQNARAAFTRATALVGDAGESLIDDALLTPEDLNQLCDLLGRSDDLRKVPQWLWSSDDDQLPFDSTGATIAQIADLLTSPERRNRIGQVLSLLDHLGEPAALNWLEAPPSGDDADSHIQTWFSRSQTLFATAPPDVLAWLREGTAGASDVSLMEGVADRQRDLEKELAEQASASIRAHLGTLTDLAAKSRVLAAYERAVDFYREQFGDPRDAPYAALRKKADRELSLVSAAQSEGPTPVVEDTIEVDHNWMETKASRATLVFHQPDPTVEYGFLSAPIVVETLRPRQVDVRLRCEVRGDYRSAWPKEWPNPEPSDPFTIPVYGWQAQPDSSKFQFPVALRIPVRRPRQEPPRLEVELSVVDAASQRQLGDAVMLKWEAIATRPVAVTAQFAGATNPDYVRVHPIGPQARAADILERLRAGSSLAVIAPRRFGKSTLVEYLLTAGKEAGMVTPPAIVCTEFSTVGGGLDYDRLWSHVSDELQRQLGSGLPRKWSGILPDDAAFDDVRRAAKLQGHQSVVLLFDEAQLLFSRENGPTTGTRLKNLLERRWGRSDDLTKVPLLIGLIGLPTLAERAGADLMGLLNPVVESVFRENELRRLIAGMTTGLQSTRAARMRLAETSGNLFILRVLIERLVRRVRDDSRVWANFDDVVAIENELKKELHAGREETVASYIRDALNGAEKVTDWEPVPSYPLAAAVAEVAQQCNTHAEISERAIETLNRWCRLNSADDAVRPVYDRQAVDRHLAQLHERRVLKDYTFTSSLLEAWLQGVARRGPYDAAFQEALFRGAQRRIQIPRGVDRVADGGQAVIYRAADSKGQVAYRVRKLQTPAEEEHFRTSVEMFEALRAGVLRREPGSEFLFDLIEIGLSAQDTSEAILVYRWVEGQDLSHRVGRLPGDMVVDIGVKLARALRLIHSNGVLHRDIRPSNVVLDERLMRPVLIDFGFARRVGTEMRTVLAGEWCAPEVRRDNPNWTKAADVYGLGATLKALMKPSDKDAVDLTRALSAALAERPEARPTGDAFLESMENLEHGRTLEAKRQQAWNEVRLAIDRDKHKQWFTSVVNKMRPHFEAMALGLFQTPLERYREVADFLNQVLEAFPGAGLSLKNLSMRRPDVVELPTVLAVRNYDAHAGQALWREGTERLKKFQAAPEAQRRKTFNTAVELVGKEVQIGSLTPLLEKFYPQTSAD